MAAVESMKCRVNTKMSILGPPFPSFQMIFARSLFVSYARLCTFGPVIHDKAKEKKPETQRMVGKKKSHLILSCFMQPGPESVIATMKLLKLVNYIMFS